MKTVNSIERVNISSEWQEMELPQQVVDLFRHATSLRFPASREEMFSMAMGGRLDGTVTVGYHLPGRGKVSEATVTKCRNGLVINYLVYTLGCNGCVPLLDVVKNCPLARCYHHVKQCECRETAVRLR